MRTTHLHDTEASALAAGSPEHSNFTSWRHLLLVTYRAL